MESELADFFWIFVKKTGQSLFRFVFVSKPMFNGLLICICLLDNFQFANSLLEKYSSVHQANYVFQHSIHQHRISMT